MCVAVSCTVYNKRKCSIILYMNIAKSCSVVNPDLDKDPDSAFQVNPGPDSNPGF